MNPIISHALIGLSTLVIGVCVGYSLRDHNKFNSQKILNVAMAFLSVAAMSGLFVGINQYRDATTCQTQYNTNFIKSLKERGEAASEDRQATRKMIATILSSTATPEQRKQSIIDWDKALESADQKRDSNPIPITPDCVQNVE